MPSTKEGSTDEEEEFFLSRYWNVLIQEARAVSLWSCVSIMLRLVVLFLCMLASYRNDKEVLHDLWFVRTPVSGVSQEFWTIASVFAGWILCFAPGKVLLQQAPGFIFANPV